MSIGHTWQLVTTYWAQPSWSQTVNWSQPGNLAQPVGHSLATGQSLATGHNLSTGHNLDTCCPQQELIVAPRPRAQLLAVHTWQLVTPGNWSHLETGHTWQRDP